MTHEQIDAMPAGPELDALACAAVGWEPKHQTRFFCGQCGCEAGKSGPTCGGWMEKQVVVVKPISTDTVFAMAALTVAYSGRITYIRSYGWVVSMVTQEKQGDPAHDVSAMGDTAPLAIARALAKMGAAK